MAERVFYLLAGPNGAGKSSLYRAAVKDGLIPSRAEFVNADLYERDHLQHIADLQQRSEAARDWADTRRATLIASGDSFVSETVFSHSSKIALIQEAQAAGYVVVLLVVCMDQPERLLLRVRQRVSEGGHNVPDQRILDRYPRTLANLQQAVREADMAILYDNPGEIGERFTAPKRVAVCRKQNTRILHQPLPQWAHQVLGISVA
ncbi:zeta toxin family protein [Variovorax sp. PCZ-1]|uniref:zeta toxin family protein n=1 Tax=Variovorax sp. PCZ-1 TaxID=2835533 RepID=UPI001BCE69DF|nr:zeta toxin family protein [Variovorax sp. PCZ-1]MBS7806597.1 zeta toxin family protein [Variovorax sp. PCZ-1]